MENPLHITSVLQTVYRSLTTSEMHSFSLQILLLKSDLSSHDVLCFLILVLYPICYDDCMNMNKVNTVIPQYPGGIGSRTHAHTTIRRCSSSLYKMS